VSYSFPFQQEMEKERSSKQR